MKASSLWPGTDYAYQQYLGRGRALPLNANRVKVLELIKQPIPGGKKSRTSVLVAFLDDEGAAITEGYDSNPRHVKAPDIIDFWDEYEEMRKPLLEERERREVERQERYAKQRKEREERDAITAVASFIYYSSAKMRQMEKERIEREQREKEEKRRRRIKNVLITRGLKSDEIVFNGTVILIPLDEIERWLGIDSEPIKQGFSSQPS